MSENNNVIQGHKKKKISQGTLGMIFIFSYIILLCSVFLWNPLIVLALSVASFGLVPVLMLLPVFGMTIFLNERQATTADFWALLASLTTAVYFYIVYMTMTTLYETDLITFFNARTIGFALVITLSTCLVMISTIVGYSRKNK